jgi:hypothetical protein
LGCDGFDSLLGALGLDPVSPPAGDLDEDGEPPPDDELLLELVLVVVLLVDVFTEPGSGANGSCAAPRCWAATPLVVSASASVGVF